MKLPMKGLRIEDLFIKLEMEYPYSTTRHKWAPIVKFPTMIWGNWIFSIGNQTASLSTTKISIRNPQSTFHQNIWEHELGLDLIMQDNYIKQLGTLNFLRGESAPDITPDIYIYSNQGKPQMENSKNPSIFQFAKYWNGSVVSVKFDTSVLRKKSIIIFVHVLKLQSPSINNTSPTHCREP